MLGNRYIFVAIDYRIKWVEAWTLYTNTTAITTKFVYKHILTRFGCPLTIVIDQGTHFNNDVIRYFTNHFILRHTIYIIYYPQGNGHVESTNKVFGTLLTKLVNENRNDWDEFYFHIKLRTKLKPVIPHFKWCMDYIHYYLQSTCYHLNLVKIEIHNMLKF
jgi:transposase InsO family protein